MNAGGFARNQKMRDQYQPGARADWSNTIESDTGEMILEMIRHGAAVAQMEEMVGYQTTIPPGQEQADIKLPAQSLTGKPHAILVDQSGVRYQNEGGSYMAYCKGMFERNKSVPAIPSWAIFDSQYMANYMLAGTMPGRKKPPAWHEAGYLCVADSIAELAIKIKVDPLRLKSTVDRFNEFVNAGCDLDFHRGERAYDEWLGDPFHRPSKSLGRIEMAPFYGVPVVPGDVSTFGGVVTDANARVLKEDGTPILGLYATGTSTASVMGRAYPGAGSSIGPSFTWGFVAARHAAGINSPPV
jgi:3-oxosteroid 1-dehydrogenase